MEKRRLLLVVMLLATSGAALASGSEDEGGAGTGDGQAGETTKLSRKARFKAGWERRASRHRWFPSLFKNTRATLEFQWQEAKNQASDPDGSYVSAAAEVATAPFWAVWDTTLADFCPCLSNINWVGTLNVGTGVALGVTGTLAYKAWKNKGKASEGVKKLLKGIRSFSFRKKAPEKKTDASTIEA